MSQPQYQSLLYQVDDPVATISFHRPDRLNALTGPMLLELADAFGRAERDDAVVGIVLTGSGRGFSAGADMEMLSAVSQGEGSVASEWRGDIEKPGDPEMGDDFRGGYTWMLSVRKPVLAAINGPCAGLGFVLAMLCDIRFAAAEAVFTTAFANRGLIAEHGISWILPRLVGPSHALDLLWTGRKFGADEALRLGVVNRVVPQVELLVQSRSYIIDLARSSAPSSLQIMKRQVYRHLNLPLGPALEESNRLMAESLTRDDFKEGVASFLEKRQPRFGRVGEGTAPLTPTPARR
ncbi:MAG TPA: enoyl-CoA hydratase-related protein [Thermoanaerobaculia bacterium]|nr:enoyl-CoA hydratase-related protein [Thermoanaerobaculia bacterium]